MSSIMPTDAVWWQLFTLFTSVGILLAGTVTLIFIYLIYRYGIKRGKVDEDFEDLEPGRVYVETPARGISKVMLLFTGLIVLSLIVSTFDETIYLERPPAEDALVIWVVGFQFGWEFRYNVDGQEITTIGAFVVPTDTLIEFKVTSRDVFHSFGFPEFKNKIDAIPGIVNSMWIKTPKEPGVYTAYCYELCGIGHSLMTADMIVVDSEEFYKAYNAGPQEFQAFLNQVISEYRASKSQG